MTGLVSMDGNNDRDTDFNLWAMGDPESGQYEVGGGTGGPAGAGGGGEGLRGCSRLGSVCPGGGTLLGRGEADPLAGPSHPLGEGGPPLGQPALRLRRG